MSAQVGRGSLNCLNNSKQQEQNLTNTLKLFHESCLVSDNKSICVCTLNLKILAITFLVPASFCPPWEYVCDAHLERQGIASDVTLLFLVISVERCSSTWPLTRSLLCSLPPSEIVWQLPTSGSLEMVQTNTLYWQLRLHDGSAWVCLE